MRLSPLAKKIQNIAAEHIVIFEVPWNKVQMNVIIRVRVKIKIQYK